MAKNVEEEEQENETSRVKKEEEVKITSCLVWCFMRNKGTEKDGEMDVESLPLEQIRARVLRAARELYNAHISVWPDDERVFFWRLLSYTDQAVLYSVTRSLC